MRSRRTDPLSTGREVDRLMAFSDGVVAVAITLMVIPLINLPSPSAGEQAYTVFTNNFGQFTIFLFTFFVVAVMWRIHSRNFAQIRGYDNTLFWLNVTWLAAIVLLPWLSSLYGDTSGFRHTDQNFSSTGTGAVDFLYWILMASVSALGNLMGRHLRRNPQLLLEGTEPRLVTGLARFRGAIMTGYFAFIGVVCLASPTVGSYLPLGIFVLVMWLKPRSEPVDVNTSGIPNANGETS